MCTDIENLGNSELWMKDVNEVFAMVWRFIPMADPLGKVFKVWLVLWEAYTLKTISLIRIV